MTLLDLCIEKIVTLLQNNYWPIGIHGFDEHNPFTAIPSDLTEKLFNATVSHANSGMLTVKDLYPMLVSGRLKNFKLEYIIITHEELICILTTLSIQGIHLTGLVLDEIQFLTPKYINIENVSQPLALAIESLLYLSPNLKNIRIGIQFDLKALQQIQTLKRLELNFAPKNGLYDIILKIDEAVYVPNDTLTYFSVAKEPRHIITVEEIAFILQYCPELTYFENNIAGGLELLHESELSDGSLQKQYKLQKIVLGDIFLGEGLAVASISAIHIASITCPNLKNLEILVNDHKAIAALRYFRNLDVLLIQWEMIATPGDFRLSVQLAMDEIGLSLKKLSIVGFCNINFEALSCSCPHLEYLRIEYFGTENESTDIECFKNLESLFLECTDNEGANRQTLLQLLSSCKNLNHVNLENIPSLDNETLTQILNRNCLSKLTEAHLVTCSIGSEGLRLLIHNCEHLKFLRLVSTNIEFEEAVDIIHTINPFIILID